MHGNKRTSISGKDIQCEVGPIYVLYHPRVFVNPTSLVVTNHHETQLECFADGYPDNFTFSWSCSKTDIFNGCGGKSQTINLSVNKFYIFPASGSESVLVTCAASNSIGTGTASSLVKVERMDSFGRKLDHLNATSVSCQHELSNMIIYGQYFEKHRKKTRFQCLLNKNETMVDEFQLGSLNGTKVSSFLDHEFPLRNITLQLWNISKSNTDETLVCEITTCNDTRLTFASVLSHHSVLEIDITSTKPGDIKISNCLDNFTAMELPHKDGSPKVLIVWQTATIAITSIVAIIILILAIKGAIRARINTVSKERVKISQQIDAKIM